MSLSQKQISELLIIAKKAAKKAGQIISDFDTRQVNIQTKAGGQSLASTVVTQVDLNAEKAILNILYPTLSEYDLGLLTEESIDDNSRFKKNYFWCIDPLDGTLAFTQNKDGYSTSIALVSKMGVPIIGVVYDPRNHNLYYAIKGAGAYKNEEPFLIKNNDLNLHIFYDQSYLQHPAYKTHIDKLKEKIKDTDLNKLTLNPLGGAVMNAISTIENAPAIYYKLPKKELGGGSLWDFAATSVIHFEAGGFNSDFHQAPLDLNCKTSTFMNKNGVTYSSSKSLLEILTCLGDF